MLVPAAGSAPPDHLAGAGRAVWEVVTSCAWMAESDRVAVTMLCELFDRRAGWLARLEASAPVLYTDKGYAYANPLVGMLSTVERELGRAMAALGLTPADRTRLGLAEVKAKSKLEEMMEARQRRTT
ncbi:phage terminase small subunit P27 family [Streptomyces sp. H10-C2]|nr:phage terminase small subunit P27 family [Streptomyces sp. H10-C2]